jgi:hypothetical protein
MLMRRALRPPQPAKLQRSIKRAGVGLAVFSKP